MRYNPKDATLCFPAGEYEAVLESAEETVSKQGNEMVVVVWVVFDNSGRSTKVKDYIVNPSTLFKMKAIAKALDKLAEFDAAEFQLSDNLDCHITVKLEIEDDPQFGEKNVIKGYKKPGLGRPVPAQMFKNDEGDIPF